jgi:hypothetical protein
VQRVDVDLALERDLVRRLVADEVIEVVHERPRRAVDRRRAEEARAQLRERPRAELVGDRRGRREGRLAPQAIADAAVEEATPAHGLHGHVGADDGLGGGIAHEPRLAQPAPRRHAERALHVDDAREPERVVHPVALQVIAHRLRGRRRARDRDQGQPAGPHARLL